MKMRHEENLPQDENPTARLSGLEIKPREAVEIPPLYEADLDRLLQILERLKTAAKKRDRRVVWMSVGVVGGCLTMPFVLVGALIVAVFSRRRPEDMAFIDTLNDVRTIGPLCEMADVARGGDRDTVLRALIRLLPKLKASDAGLLNPPQRIGLYRTMWNATPSRDASFLVAGLKAMEQVGDSQALLYVRRFATMPVRTQVDQQVQDAASECIPFLEALAAKEQSAQTLLRAVDAPSDPSSTLLRPAAGSTEHDPQQLLRPSEPD